MGEACRGGGVGSRRGDPLQPPRGKLRGKVGSRGDEWGGGMRKEIAAPDARIRVADAAEALLTEVAAPSGGTSDGPAGGGGKDGGPASVHEAAKGERGPALVSEGVRKWIRLGQWEGGRSIRGQ